MKMKIRQITAAMVCALVIAGEAATAACAAGTLEREYGRPECGKPKWKYGRPKCGELADENVRNHSPQRRFVGGARKTQFRHLRQPLKAGPTAIELDVGVTKDGVVAW